jgi:hypothetical protein
MKKNTWRPDAFWGDTLVDARGVCSFKNIQNTQAKLRVRSM